MSAALVERSAVVVKRRKHAGRPLRRRRRHLRHRGHLPAAALARARCPGPPSRSPTGARASVLVDSNGRPVRTGHAGRRRHHDRLPRGHRQPPDRLHHRRGPGGRPDRADPGVGRAVHHRARPRDLDARRLRGLLQGLHPPGLPGRPLRAGARAAGLPVPPVDVQRAQRRRAPVRSGPPPAAPAAPRLQRRRLPASPGRLRPAGRARLLGAELRERHRTADDQAQRARRPWAPTGTWARSSASSTTGSGVAKGGRVFLDKIFPDHWSFMLGEIALYSFVVLLATGVFLSLYFVPSTNQVIYHGTYTPLDGQWVSEAYASTVNISFAVRGGLLDAPDAPLGGRHLHRLHRRAHGPHLLHRRLPQAPRAQLAHRHHHADPGHPRGLHRLLAARRPDLGHRASASATPSPSRSPSSAATWSRSSGAASSRATASSSRASSSSTS